MDIKELLSQGYLITPDAKKVLEQLSDAERSYLLKKISGFIIDASAFNIIPKIKILQELEQKNFLSINDFAQRYMKRWEILQKILLSRVELNDAVSVASAQGNCTVIGLITKRQDHFILEDPTGTLTLFIKQQDAEKIENDDVIAAKGTVNNKTMDVSEIIYPDVQIHMPRKTSYDLFISCQQNETLQDCDVSFIIDEDQCKLRYPGKEIVLKNPSLISLNDVIILYYSGTQYPINVLRKRFIQRKYSDFILENVPDVIVTNAVKDPINYKGVSVLPPGYILNLKNYEKTKIQDVATEQIK